MEEEPYIILRITRSVSSGYGTLSNDPWRGAGEGEAGEVDFKVEAETLTERDAVDLRRDPNVACMTPPMPLRLIEPLAEAGLVEAPPVVKGTAWGVTAVGALTSPYTGAGIVPAVLDTGVDAGHEAFRGLTLVQKDFTGEGDGDDHGHGTHVAGTIFGQDCEGVRIGVAPGVRRALIGKVLGVRHRATTLELTRAIQWALDEGAQVIIMSLGFDFPGIVKLKVDDGWEVDLATSRALAVYRDNIRLLDRLMDMLRERARFQGSALVIAAAGNESKRGLRLDYTIDASPPAAAEGILAVAALGRSEGRIDRLRVAPFSNIGAAVAAPGEEIYSAKTGGGCTPLSGTSMAGPHVAGVAALWAEYFARQGKQATPDRLRDRVLSSARRIADAKIADVGDGLVTAPQD